MAKSTQKKASLEQSIEELEKLVSELESGDLPLEEALKKFERGVSLTRECQKSLSDAEQRVEILLKQAGVDADPAPFEADD